MSEWLAFDTRLYVLVNQEWVHPILDVVMPYLTDFDHWRVPLVIVLLFALARGKAEARVALLVAILAVAVADQIASSGVKPIFERPRPFHVVEGARQLVGAHSFSFPSSHAANTFAAGVFLAMRFARLRWLLLIPLVVAYSRVYVGVHYPFDVLAGAALGSGIGATFAALERMSRIRLERWLSFGRGRKAPALTDGAEDGGPAADSGTPEDGGANRESRGQDPGDTAD